MSQVKLGAFVRATPFTDMRKYFAPQLSSPIQQERLPGFFQANPVQVKFTPRAYFQARMSVWAYVSGKLL
jgi:hypothetical protein